MVEVFFSAAAYADCTAYNAQDVARVIRPSVLKIQTIGAAACSGNGTGFVVSKDGLVVTAKHVVPAECDGETIVGLFQNSPHVFHLQVVERSGLDVAVLKITDGDGNFPPLTLIRPISDESFYADKDVAVASFYPEYPMPTLTAAHIDSTTVIGQTDMWGLCAIAANPSRSGSPVAMPDGSVVAVFVERPSGGIQDIAHVVPIAAVTDIHILNNGSSNLKLVPKPGSPIAHVRVANTGLYEFNLDVSVAAHNAISDRKGRFVFKNGTYTSAESASYGELLLQFAQGGSVRYANNVEQNYRAPVGYRFDPSVFGLHISSENPNPALLPSVRCAAERTENCYEFRDGNRSLALHLRIFAGWAQDRTHGWLNGSVLTKLISDSE